MNKKNLKIYFKIYESPIRSDILWSDIESLFVSLGGEIVEGNGSRIGVILNGERAVFHRPHPQKEADKGAVKAVRLFLERAGVRI